MRTVLVPTDFSEPAQNAARYALHLALALQANLHLCHAFLIPGGDPALSAVAWTGPGLQELQEERDEALSRTAEKLQERRDATMKHVAGTFRPEISWSSSAGETAEIINKVAEKTDALLIVMGMTGIGKLNRFIFGSSSIRMMDTTRHPLLIIPYDQKFTGLEKIAFSTDLTTKDTTKAEGLAKFAGYFGAELLIAHIPNFVEIIDENEYRRRKEAFLKNLQGKISYLSVESDNIDSGLEIIKSKDIDMLVMGHQYRGFLDRLIFGSYAVRHAGEIKIPLMVIPEGASVSF